MGLEEIKRRGAIPGLVSFLTGAKRRKPVPRETTIASSGASSGLNA
jgi:hypothetical protein